jgi:hypothetical protein
LGARLILCEKMGLNNMNWFFSSSGIENNRNKQQKMEFGKRICAAMDKKCICKKATNTIMKKGFDV